MKLIISGTNRPNARSLQISKLIQSIYKDLGEETEILDLKDVPLTEVDGSHFKDKPAGIDAMVEKVGQAEGLIMVVPEYNGSMPGALKYFIDHWKFPETFQARPICYVGLGGRFAGVRPVEHLQQIFAYRDAYSFPKRVFLSNIWGILNEKGELTDEMALKLLKTQARDFQKFVKALQAEGLDANSLGPEDYQM